MSKTETGSQILLEMLKKEQITNDLMENVKDKLLNTEYTSIKYQAQKYFVNSGKSYSEKELIGSTGNFENGKEIFKSYCVNCHKVGAIGAEIGPELTKIGQKLDKTGLFEALVKPNSSIVFGYETSTYETKDGNSYYGILISENNNNLTIKDIAGNKTTIAQKNIKTRKKEMGSIMPSASSFNIEPAQLSDLLTYLTKLN
jgi:putative heme-binding domain-containing protein